MIRVEHGTAMVVLEEDAVRTLAQPVQYRLEDLLEAVWMVAMATGQDTVADGLRAIQRRLRGGPA